MKALVLSLAFGLVLFVVTVQAHHSISGTYTQSKVIRVEGTIREFHFVNPHPFLVLEVLDANGTVQMWQLEMDSRSELAEAGMTKTTFKFGDRIAVAGNPAIAQKESLYIRKLERPSDGFRYEQVGASPRIIPKPQ